AVRIEHEHQAAHGRETFCSIPFLDHKCFPESARSFVWFRGGDRSAACPVVDPAHRLVHHSPIATRSAELNETMSTASSVPIFLALCTVPSGMTTVSPV